jgi:Zn-finger nucleic acid-binding protein
MDKLKALYYLKKKVTPKKRKVILDKSKLNRVSTDLTLPNKPKQFRNTPFACYHDESNEFMAKRELEKQKKREELAFTIDNYEEKKYQEGDFVMNEKFANFCDFITDVFIDPHNRYGIERNRDKIKRITGVEKKGILQNLYDFLTPDKYE